MERLATLFTGSFRQLKQVKTVTVCAMLGAVAIVLGSLSIELGSTLRIGFTSFADTSYYNRRKSSTCCSVL